MISLIFIFLTGCFPQKTAESADLSVQLICVPQERIVYVGAVDNIENRICKIQIASGRVITVESEICKNFREGDEIRVIRK